jgi:Fic family protein
MSRDPIVRGVLELAASWEEQANAREQHAPGVPDAVAATLRTRATELRARAEELERETAYLTVSDYARQADVSENTVRRLCRDGMLEGAERNEKDDWRIPRSAKRRAVAS